MASKGINKTANSGIMAPRRGFMFVWQCMAYLLLDNSFTNASLPSEEGNFHGIFRSIRKGGLESSVRQTPGLSLFHHDNRLGL